MTKTGNRYMNALHAMYKSVQHDLKKAGLKAVLSPIQSTDYIMFMVYYVGKKAKEVGLARSAAAIQRFKSAGFIPDPNWETNVLITSAFGGDVRAYIAKSIGHLDTTTFVFYDSTSTVPVIAPAKKSPKKVAPSVAMPVPPPRGEPKKQTKLPPSMSEPKKQAINDAPPKQATPDVIPSPKSQVKKQTKLVTEPVEKPATKKETMTAAKKAASTKSATKPRKNKRSRPVPEVPVVDIDEPKLAQKIAALMGKEAPAMDLLLRFAVDPHHKVLLPVLRNDQKKLKELMYNKTEEATPLVPPPDSTDPTPFTTSTSKAQLVPKASAESEESSHEMEESSEEPLARPEEESSTSKEFDYDEEEDSGEEDEMEEDNEIDLRKQEDEQAYAQACGDPTAFTPPFTAPKEVHRDFFASDSEANPFDSDAESMEIPTGFTVADIERAVQQAEGLYHTLMEAAARMKASHA